MRFLLRPKLGQGKAVEGAVHCSQCNTVICHTLFSLFPQSLCPPKVNVLRLMLHFHLFY